jgi:transmembrane sensor
MSGLDFELLARFVAGDADAPERARVESWSASDPANARELERLRRGWVSGRPAAGAWDVDRAWARVSARLDAGAVVVPIGRRRRAWIGVAAAAVLALAAAGLLLRPPATTYATEPGAQRTIELGDGSRVVLAPASRLEVDRRYGERDRGVLLEGRAWFVVTHDEARPFRVRAGGVLVEDLGTEFEVQAPRGQDAIQVVVVAGAVAVRGASDPRDRAVTLRPGDLARVPTQGAPVVRHEAPVDRLVAWRVGTLGFDQAPLPEVLAELGRWYGLEFRLGDTSLAARHLSATFPTADLDETLAILTAALGLSATRGTSVITLDPRTGR